MIVIDSDATVKYYDRIEHQLLVKSTPSIDIMQA